jgi:hypothetical protein
VFSLTGHIREAKNKPQNKNKIKLSFLLQEALLADFVTSQTTDPTNLLSEEIASDKKATINSIKLIISNNYFSQ